MGERDMKQSFQVLQYHTRTLDRGELARIDLQVVALVGVNGLELPLCQPFPSVSSRRFPCFEDLQRAKDLDVQNVISANEIQEVLTPARELQNVVNDDPVVQGRGKRNRSVEYPDRGMQRVHVLSAAYPSHKAG